VIKADGLAAGKGTAVCYSHQEAEEAIDEFMVRQSFGRAGARVEIEEFLRGPELSAFALVDGEHFQPLLAARDHKQIFDGNEGPNTGGMGGYARPSYATPELMDELGRRVFAPVVASLAARGCPFVGVLYAGLFLTDQGPKVIEFNCRWGDPEAQLLLPLLESDLVDVMSSCIEGRLDQLQIEWSKQVSVGVALASAGYPASSHKGDPISGLDQVGDDAIVFHAATRRSPSGELTTDGGRVLTVVALGDTLAQASEKAYSSVERIHFDGMHYRRDVASDDVGAAVPSAILEGTPHNGDAKRGFGA
jgi:phosphoribosylamine--glycine ligase